MEIYFGNLFSKCMYSDLIVMIHPFSEENKSF